MAGEGGLLAAVRQMDQKTLIGFIIAFCLASVISSRISDWFENLPWRKALHEKAMQIVEEAKAKEAAEEAKKAKKKK